MQDLLYFNLIAISLDNIASVAMQVGCEVQYGGTEASGSYLGIYHGGTLYGGNTAAPELYKDRWIVEHTDLDEYDIEEDRPLVEAYGPVALLSVQYRVAYLCVLTKFLWQVIERYGGWVYGADNKIHDAATVECMQFITGDGEIYVDCGKEQ